MESSFSFARQFFLEYFSNMKTAAVALLLIFSTSSHAQERPSQDRTSAWLPWQFVPNFTFTATPTQTPFGLEWEATPLLYSFGISRLVSPWYSFIVEPVARFSGSVELVVTGQLYPNKLGTSHFGYSGQLLGHVPLIERGEHLALNVGVATYRIGNDYPVFKVLGVSTLFGFIHFNVKQASNPDVWVWSFEFRMF